MAKITNPIKQLDKIVVHKCGDDVTQGGCPFNYDTIECRALTKRVGGHGIEVHRPDIETCPLKEGQIIVKLESP